MRLVSFDCKSRPEMERYCREKVPVAIANCASKPSPYDGKYELLASPRKTSLERSERVFNLPADLDAIDPDYAKTVSLDEISVLVPNQRVNVCVKVLEVYGITEVTKKGTWKSLEKQEVLVADHSDTIRLVLWEKDVCRLEKGKSYKLSSVNTRSFKERAYLSVSDCTSITAIDDIGDVAEQDPDEEHTLVGDDTFTGDIVSVTSVDVYKSCMACSGKVELNHSGKLARCTKCHAMQKAITGCVEAAVARVVLQGKGGKAELRKVTIFQNVLSTLVPDCKDKYDEIPELLLSLPEVSVGIKNDIVIWAKASVENQSQ